jgi:Arc/MetJ-type ribon-helix-helix transcriptional regulator
LDAETRRRIERIARRKRMSTSAVIREAIAEWTEKEEAAATPYAIVADLVGMVHGGDPRRSEDGGKKLREALRRRRSDRT